MEDGEYKSTEKGRGGGGGSGELLLQVIELMKWTHLVLLLATTHTRKDHSFSAERSENYSPFLKIIFLSPKYLLCLFKATFHLSF